MQCFIYRSERKSGTYLFVPKKDELSHIPAPLMDLLGSLTYSFEFNLHPDKPLMQSDTRYVIQQLREKGYYVQLPPGKAKKEKLNA